MNIGLVYSIVAGVCLLVLVMILNRILSTQYRENINIQFLHLLISFSVFCLTDILWGICYAGYPFVTRWMFTSVTNVYHVMGSLSAFLWYGYIMEYIRTGGIKKTVLNIVRVVAAAYQIIFVLLNFAYKEAFFIDSSVQYHLGADRFASYAVQLIYYLVMLVYSFVSVHLSTGERRRVYKNAFVFSLIPLVFGVGQYLMFNVPMYSMGFMVMAFSIYIYDLNDMREKFLAQSARVDYMTGLLNRRAYEEEIQRLRKEGMKENGVVVYMDINSIKRTNDQIGHEAGDELIKAAGECIRRCLGGYGDSYRVGGNEFVCLLEIDRESVDAIKNRFSKMVEEWHGQYSDEMHVSAGFSSAREFPSLKVDDLERICYERMCSEKALYYMKTENERRGKWQTW